MSKNTRSTVFFSKKKIPHTKSQKRNVDARAAWFTLLTPFTVLLVLSLFLIWQRVRTDHLAHEIVILEARRARMEEKNNHLFIKTEQLAAYGRVSALAKEHLGMIRIPPQPMVLRVN